VLTSGSEESVVYLVSTPVRNDELNALFAASWEGHTWTDFEPVLNRSLAFVCAYRAGCLVGFVNLAWDGGNHAFLLDTTVHRDLRRRGIGRELVYRATQVARRRGAEWLHVDYGPRLRGFYERCGFRCTEAELLRLR